MLLLVFSAPAETVHNKNTNKRKRNPVPAMTFNYASNIDHNKLERAFPRHVRPPYTRFDHIPHHTPSSPFFGKALGVLLRLPAVVFRSNTMTHTVVWGGSLFLILFLFFSFFLPATVGRSGEFWAILHRSNICRKAAR